MAFFIITPAAATYLFAAEIGTAIASFVGVTAVSATAATAIGAATIGATFSALKGDKPEDILKNAILGGVTSYVGGTIGQNISQTVSKSVATNLISSGVSQTTANAMSQVIATATSGAISSGTSALLQGKNPIDAMLKGGLTAGLSSSINLAVDKFTGGIPGFDSLSSSESGAAFARATKSVIAASLLGNDPSKALQSSLIDSFLQVAGPSIKETISDAGTALKNAASKVTSLQDSINSAITKQQTIAEDYNDLIDPLQDEQDAAQAAIDKYNKDKYKYDNFTSVYTRKTKTTQVKNVGRGSGGGYRTVTSTYYVDPETGKEVTKASLVPAINKDAAAANAAIDSFNKSYAAAKPQIDSLNENFKAAQSDYETLTAQLKNDVQPSFDEAVKSFNEVETANTELIANKLQNFQAANDKYKELYGKDASPEELSKIIKSDTPDYVKAIEEQYKVDHPAASAEVVSTPAPTTPAIDLTPVVTPSAENQDATSVVLPSSTATPVVTTQETTPAATTQDTSTALTQAQIDAAKAEGSNISEGEKVSIANQKEIPQVKPGEAVFTVSNPMTAGERNQVVETAINTAKTFDEAYAAARAGYGAGKTFTWKGNSFSTNTRAEDPALAAKSDEIRLNKIAASDTAGSGRGAMDGFSAADDAAFKAVVTQTPASQTPAKTTGTISADEDVVYDPLTGLPVGGTSDGTMSASFQKFNDAIGKAVQTSIDIGLGIPAGGANLLGQIGSIGLMTGLAGPDNALLKTSKEIQASINNLRSTDFKSDQALMNQAISKAGDEGTFSQVVETFKQFGVNPIQTAAFIAENGVTLLTGSGAMVAARALGAGMKMAEVAAITANAVTQGADIAQNAYDQAIALGETPEEALRRGRIAGSIATATSAIANKFIPGALSNEQKIAQQTIVKESLKSALKGELSSELAEEVSGKIATNMVNGQAWDKDIGSTAVQAIIASGTITGAVHSGQVLQQTSPEVEQQIIETVAAPVAFTKASENNKTVLSSAQKVISDYDNSYKAYQSAQEAVNQFEEISQSVEANQQALPEAQQLYQSNKEIADQTAQEAAAAQQRLAEIETTKKETYSKYFSAETRLKK